jgi:Divergent InlB B-repeat domain
MIERSQIMHTRKIPGLSLVPMILVLAIFFFATPSSIVTAQTPGTPVPAAALNPTASAVINFTQLAQQEASNPGPVRQPQAMPLALPGGQDSSALAGSSLTPALSQLPSPAPSASFEGLGDNNTATPAGISGAVGSGYVLTALNSQIRVESPTGVITGTLSTDRFWAAVLPAGSTGVFDLRAAYDPTNQRWIIAAASDAYNANSSVVVAVSATGDPTGTWYLFRYDADAQNQNWADYPMLGFNKDWIVVSANMFTVGPNAFVQGQVYALNKTKLYADDGTGGAVFSDKSIPFSLQPAETYDSSLGTEYLVRHVSSAIGNEAKSTLIGAPPALPTLTIDTAMFASNLGDWSVPAGNSLPQSGASTGLDVGDARVQQVVVRTVNGQTSIWFVQTIALPAGSAPTHFAVQWWQVDGSSGSSTAVLQQGRIEDPAATPTNGGKDYAYPSLAVNRNNDVLVGYSVFSSNQFPSAGYSFRAGTDAPNTMRAPTLFKAGLGPYVKTLGGPLNRWGDFSHSVVDPADGTSLWTLQAYANTPVGIGDGSGRWGTWWARVQLPPPSAGGAPAAACYTLTTSVSPDASGSIGVSLVPNCNNGTQYLAGTIVTLTAYEGSGNGFSSWSGDASGTSNPTAVTMDGDKNVTANFTTGTGGGTSSSFGKSSPSDGATGQSTELTLSWNGSSGASSYQYCLDTSNNNTCDNAWTNVGDNTSVGVIGLAINTTYYWQVRSLDGNGNIIAKADGGTWWSFTTGTSSANAFGKTSPANGATGQPSNPTLTWGTSSGASKYQYCVDTTNNNSCDNSWTNVGTATSAVLSGLSLNTTYYWQVRSLDGNGNVIAKADNGTWWSFSTGTSSTPPGAFGKSSPANGTTGQPSNPTLTWGTSSGASSYRYCVDTTNNNNCDLGWTNVGTATSVGLNGLNNNTTYYWQVQALNSNGTTVADGGTWWLFTTSAPLTNDDFNTATPITTRIFLTSENTTTATSAADDPTFPCAGVPGTASVWFKFTPASYGLFGVTTNGSTYDTILGVWRGTRGSLTNVACNDNNKNGTASTLLVHLNGGTTYYLEVAGHTAGGGLNLIAGFTGTASPVVTLLSPANGSQSTATSRVLDWTDSAGAAVYHLEVRQGSVNGAVVVSGLPTVSNYTTGSLAPAPYFWRVQACNTSGCSAWSPSWSFVIASPPTPVQVNPSPVNGGKPPPVSPPNGSKPPPVKLATPNLLSPANGSTLTGQVTLDWSDSAGATYYHVLIRQNKTSGPVVVLSSPTNSTFTTAGLANRHMYYWRVQACNANGCGDWTGWERFIFLK